MAPAYLPPTGPAGDRTGVLLVNLGTPDAPTPAAVRRYLAQFLHDYRVVDLTRWLWCPILHGIILPLRSPKVARAYASIWTQRGSPLRAFSEDLVAAVQAHLPDASVALAMTYGQPSIPDVMARLQAEGCERFVVLPLYPQYSATTTAAVHDAVMRTLLRWRRQPALQLVNDYHGDDAWLDALATSVRTHWDRHGRGQRLLLSFHGIPQRYARAGDPYPQQCDDTAQALAVRLGLSEGEWAMTYQSRFGREPWLQPYTDKTLEAWGKAGVGDIDVLCPGFAVDCLETLEEIAEQNAHAFAEAGGGKLRYIACLNADPAHAEALAGIVRRRLGPA